MRFSRFLLPAVFLSFATLAGGDPPSWWSQAHSSDPQLPEPDLPPVLTTAAANNKGPANIGQAKHMARSALLALRQVAPQVAANVESELVGDAKPILSWEGPADQAERDKNRAPLLIGQLKAIAAPFYESLHAAEPDWLEAQLTASQTKDPADPDHFYPWTSGTTDDQNKAPATIGQLKAVFSLDFASLSTGGHDGDGDGVPDAWELEFLREIAALFDLSNLPQTAAEHDVTHDYTGIGVTASATYARQEASNGSGAPSAVFNSGVLYPDGNPYYYTDGKSPVRYQAFVESASGVSTSYFESWWKSVTAAENVYTKCTVNSTRVSTHGTSSSTYTYDSELNTVLTLSPPKDFVYDDIGNWGFVARVQDLRCSLSGNIRTVSSYTEDADDPPSKVVKIENSANYSDLIYEPYISTGWFYGEGESGDVPIVTWETVTTKKDGSKTYASSNSEANVSHRLALGSIRFSDSSDPLRYDASGAGFSETAVLSEPIPRAAIGKELYELAKANVATVNMPTRSIDGFYFIAVPGSINANYAKATWVVHGADDRDYLLLITKTFRKFDWSRAEPEGSSWPAMTTEKRYEVRSLKANTKEIITEEADPGEDFDGVTVSLDLLPVDIVAHKRGTIDAPGEEQPKGNGEYGYETVMMENADSEDNNTGKRDCDTAAVDKAKDDDLVKIVLHYPGLKIEGASLELKHEGIAVDAKVKGSEMEKPDDAIEVLDTGSRLNFYDKDGNKLDPATDLKIADLKNPGGGYLAKILDPENDGKLILFIEGADDFGTVGPSLGPVEYRHGSDTITDAKSAAKKLGGSRLKFIIEMGQQKAEIPLLVYRGGFLAFKQPSGSPGVAGTFEFWDGKGRVRHTYGGHEDEFQEDDTDWGVKLKSWSVKSGKATGKDYNLEGKNGHTPPGWWINYERTRLSGGQENTSKGEGDSRIITQGSYCRWQQDDAAAEGRYTEDYKYDASKPKDASIGEPTSISFKFELLPLPPSSGQTRTDIQIHPDGKQDGTAGCIGIQKYDACLEIRYVLRSYNNLKIKVEAK